MYIALWREEYLKPRTKLRPQTVEYYVMESIIVFTDINSIELEKCKIFGGR